MRGLFTILFILCGFIALAQPANDLCTAATPTIADGTCYSGTTTAANDNIAAEVGCATQGGPNGHRDAWYTFTPTTTTVTFNITSPSGSTIELLLASGTCAALVLENSTCQTSPLITTFAGLVAGQTYFYVVSFPSNVQSTFTSCVTSIAEPPSAGQNCNAALPICSNSSFGGNSDGFGVQELDNTNHGCLTTNERQSSWYYFQVQTTGTLDMTIDPSNNVDYDFALWGPMASYACPVTGPPVRCSYASGFATLVNTGSYNTGFGPTGTEASDGTGGTLNGWASSLNVTAGQFYILCVDNFTIDNTPFTLSWGGSSVLSCALLPVELAEFNGTSFSNHNLISWTTSSEDISDYFMLEHSDDAAHFHEIYRANAAGNSEHVRRYYFRDYKFDRNTTNYYKLTEIDRNGTKHSFPLLAMDNHEEKEILNVMIYDPMGRRVNPEAYEKGLFFIVTEYKDGTFVTKKEWHQ